MSFQNKHYYEGFFFFIQDNAKPHKYGACEKFLKEYLPMPIEHQAKSPDLNPIEKIWGFLKMQVYENGKKEFSSRKLLKTAITNSPK